MDVYNFPSERGGVVRIVPSPHLTFELLTKQKIKIGVLRNIFSREKHSLSDFTDARIEKFLYLRPPVTKASKEPR